MQNIDLDEAIKEVFEVKAFRAYVYFYYFENDGMQGEIINEAFKLSKNMRCCTSKICFRPSARAKPIRL